MIEMKRPQEVEGPEVVTYLSRYYCYLCCREGARSTHIESSIDHAAAIPDFETSIAAAAITSKLPEPVGPCRHP